MKNPARREDVSKFVVHLSRDIEGTDAKANLLSILKDKKIRARNAHCLFKYEFARIGFTKVLSKKFNTACFTEAPLTQIGRLVGKIAGRQIKLRPYGLVFDKQTVLKRGANPAIYLNAKGTKFREYFLSRFRNDFSGIKTLHRLQRKEQEYFQSVIQYYSLVNIIDDRHDFMWEREWRNTGDFGFKYFDIVAIIARDPDDFEEACRKVLPGRKFRYVKMLPIISPYWNYEDIVETMSVTLWNNALTAQK